MGDDEMMLNQNIGDLKKKKKSLEHSLSFINLEIYFSWYFIAY